MRIVYYLPSLYTPGGLERIITFKANYFAEHFEGYEVYIVTSEQLGKEPHFPLSPKVKHIDLNVVFDWPFDQSRLSKALKFPFRYYRFRKRFTRLLMELRPDITLSTIRRELSFINSIADGSRKIGEFHVTRYSYGFEPRGFVGKILHKLWERSLLKNLPLLDRFIILTNEEVASWPELDNIRVIPNPVTTATNLQSDCSARQVIAVGRYDPQKGFDRLIDAWQIVARQHPSWQLRIYGEGSLRPSLQKQIDDLGITDVCTLEPTVSNITEKYSESSIFVLSSRFEGFGMVIVEAMTCGVPAVSFACPCGPRDIIQDGVDGFLVENGDIEGLAEKICHLIEHDEERKEMGRLAGLHAQRYQMKHIAQQWRELFEANTSGNESPQSQRTSDDGKKQ